MIGSLLRNDCRFQRITLSLLDYHLRTSEASNLACQQLKIHSLFPCCAHFWVFKQIKNYLNVFMHVNTTEVFVTRLPK